MDFVSLGGSATDPFVLHERNPAPLGRLGNPCGVLNGVVSRDSIVFGQRHEPHSPGSQQPRNLDAAEASINEDERQAARW